MQFSYTYKSIFITSFFLFAVLCTSGQLLQEHPDTPTYIKREFNAGLLFKWAPERDELRTDESLFSTEQTIGTAAVELSGTHMFYLPFRQDQWSYRIVLGPFMGNGNLADSTASEYIDAGLSPSGIRGNIGAAYSSRFYWDNKNYTIVGLNAWGLYDIYRRNAEGSVIDSNQVMHPYEENSIQRRLTYGFQAKAGWGIGRMSPVNHFAAAHYLLEKYYPRRNFADEEIRAVAREIGRIKHQRNLRTGHSTENETKQLAAYLNSNLFLEPPAGMEADWELTEFRPRFQGSRIEFGPFFNYYNREPDMVYGGYIRYENQKYCGPKLNRMLSAGLNYNGYKKDDWMTFEATAGWNWYPSLKQEIGFGLRYLPAMVVKSLEDLQPVRHAVVPYFEYFAQLNSRYRIETVIAYRIARKDEFVMPGPDFSVSIYRSSY